jgi:hypothetical protein
LKIADATGYLCSSPIQALNVLNLALDDHAYRKILVYVDPFDRFKRFCEALREIDLITDVYIFESEKVAFEWLMDFEVRLSKLYIDSDINKAKYLYALRHADIWVYEEGIGTYRPQHFFPRTFLGKVYRQCLSIFGYRNFRGGDRYCKGVVVHNPAYYKDHIYGRKLVRKFPLNFLEAIDRFSTLKAFSFDMVYPELMNAEVALVIGDWHGFGTMIADANLEHEIVLIKAHPKAQVIFTFNDSQLSIPQEIPVEFVIRQLLTRGCMVSIYSFRSSAAFYFEVEGTVRHYKYSPDDTEYNLSYCSVYDGLLAKAET